jgi:hypothetical protein
MSRLHVDCLSLPERDMERQLRRVHKGSWPVLNVRLAVVTDMRISLSQNELSENFALAIEE